jgi:hypothetical protein
MLASIESVTGRVGGTLAEQAAMRPTAVEIPLPFERAVEGLLAVPLHTKKGK